MRASKEFPNYLVSHEGTVVNKTTGKVINPTLDTSKRRGYYKLYIEDLNGTRKNIRVHQLVYMAFNPSYVRPNGVSSHSLVIDHIDNNKLNNHIDNLQLIPHHLNINKGTKIGRAGYRGLQWSPRGKYYLRLSFLGSKYMLDSCYPEEDLENYSIMWVTANYFLKDLESDIISEQNEALNEAKKLSTCHKVLDKIDEK